MNKSVKNIIGVTIIAASMLIGFGVGYIYKDKTITKNDDNKIEENINDYQKEQELSYDNYKVQSVIKMVGALDLPKAAVPVGNVTNYFASHKNVEIKNMSAKWRNTFVYIIYKSELEKINDNYDLSKIIIDEQTFKDYYAKCFDISTYEASNFYWFDNYEFNYDKTNKLYYTNTGVGDAYGPCGTPQTVFNKAIEKEDILEIYTYYYLYNDSGDNGVIYSDYEETTKIYESTEILSKSEIVSRFKDKLEQQKYTFKKAANGNYVFTKFEKIK